MNKKLKILVGGLLPVCASSLLAFSITASAQDAARSENLNVVDNTLKQVSELRANLAMREINYNMEKMDIELEKLRNEAASEDNSQNRNQEMEIERMRAELERSSMQMQQQQAGLSTEQQIGFRGVAVTSIYGVGDNVIAEVRVDDNKVVASKGTLLPNGEKVINVTSSGITVEKTNGSAKTYGVTGNLSTLSSYGRNDTENNMSNMSGLGVPRF